jgi:adenylate kinase
LIFLGPPGAGKGTQAHTLASYWQIPHISTGDIFRQAMRDQTPLGVKAKDYVDRGELVPDQLVVDLVAERLKQSDTQSGWILDGFPRNLNQAVFLDELLQNLEQNSTCVVNLEVPDSVVVQRLLARAEKEGRTDDTEEVISRRLEVYRQETEPLINFYRDRQQLLSVNGDRSLEQVTCELQNLLAA